MLPGIEEVIIKYWLNDWWAFLFLAKLLINLREGLLLGILKTFFYRQICFLFLNRTVKNWVSCCYVRLSAVGLSTWSALD